MLGVGRKVRGSVVCPWLEGRTAEGPAAQAVSFDLQVSSSRSRGGDQQKQSQQLSESVATPCCLTTVELRLAHVIRTQLLNQWFASCELQWGPAEKFGFLPTPVLPLSSSSSTRTSTSAWPTRAVTNCSAVLWHPAKWSSRLVAQFSYKMCQLSQKASSLWDIIAPYHWQHSSQLDIVH